MFLNFELPKRTFSCCDGCRIYQRKLADQDNFIYHSLQTVIPETSSCCLQCHRVQFLLANPVAPWRFKNLLIKKRRHCLCIYHITWLVKTQKSTTKCSFVEIVVFMRTIWSYDRNGPIINLDASVSSPSRIFVFHQRFLLFKNVYFFQPLPLRGPCVSGHSFRF